MEYRRADGRRADELRPLKFTRAVNKYAEGSCLIEQGDTRVLCTASVEDRAPAWLRDSGQGWVTGEYGMLPRATSERVQRPWRAPESRSAEIQRLIGRALRAVVDLESLGERTLTLDCDVLQADGGTRTASITGAFVALVDALEWMRQNNLLKNRNPVTDQVVAVSAGVVQGYDLLDLCYAEDSTAVADMNVVMTSRGEIVEVQVTAEGVPISRQRFDSLLRLAEKGIQEIVVKQREALLGGSSGAAQG
jgi:ribonuclease PH